MTQLSQVVYWDAPLWQVIAAGMVAAVAVGWLAWRALARPRVGDVLAGVDPALDRVALFFYDGARGLRPLSVGATRMLAALRVEGGERALAALTESVMRALEQPTVLRRTDWPSPSSSLLAVPLSMDGRVASGALAVVVDEGLVQPGAGADAAAETWLTADWERLGADLHVHRARPLVRVRRPSSGAEAAPVWTEAPLSPTEEALLRHLLAHEGELQTTDALFAVAWPTEAVDGRGARPDQRERVRRLVFQLRQRLEMEPAQPRHICTAHGIGYVFYRDSVSHES